MGKHKNATKGGSDAQKVISPTLSSHVSEAGDTDDVVCDLRDKVASLEEALSQIGASSKMPFHFVWHDGSPSKWSLSPEHWQSNPAHEDEMHDCIQVIVTLGEGGGDQPPPSHTWTGSLIANMFQGGLEEWITEAVVLAPREVILLFGWWSLKEGLPLGDTRDVGFCLGGPVNWAGREAQEEMTVSTVQEGCQAITDAIMEKRTKARGPGCPWGTTKTNWTPQQHTTLKNGCKAWRKMLPKQRWEMAKWVIMALGGGMLILNVQVEVEDDIENKVPHDYQGTLLMDLPLQGREFQTGKQTEFPSVDHDERV